MPTNWFNKPLRLPKVPHSMEDMSHNFKTSTKFGLLTPIGIEECAPADETKEYYPAAFFRLSPLLYPIMHRVHARMHTFEVPFRIILGDKLYQQFLNNEIELIPIYVIMIDEVTGEPDSAAYDSLPKYDIFTTLGYPRHSKTQYMQDGVLYEMDNGLDYLSLLLIWAEWFADVQINKTQIDLIYSYIERYQNTYGQFSNLTLHYGAIFTDLYANMGKDYFTTARPKPEYGDPVNLTGSPTPFKGGTNGSNVQFKDTDGDGVGNLYTDTQADNNNLTLDLTIRELWRREQIQRFFDVTNTFGNRTREWLAGHMGVIFPDDRLMIPRLLQTTIHDFTISEVMQTSASEQDSPLGAYAGKGTLACRGKRMKRFFVEHSLLITILSVVPEVGYTQARQRYQFKRSIFDFAIPEFNNIGYQEIFKGEIYGPSPDPKGVFGYTMRYSEYRYHPNRCSNAFADDATLLDFHLNRKFDSDPGLNPSFISANQDQFYRIFADTEADMDSILVDAAIINKMWRPVSSQPSSMHL